MKRFVVYRRTNKLALNLVLLLSLFVLSCTGSTKDSFQQNRTAAEILGNPTFAAISYGGYRSTSREIQPSLTQIKDVMHKGAELPLATADMGMDQALLLMTEKGFGCLGIIDPQEQLIGIITDGDLRRHMSADLLNKATGDIMTPNPQTILSSKLTAEALNIMNANKIQCLFVCDDKQTAKKPIGLVRVLDLLRIGTA